VIVFLGEGGELAKKERPFLRGVKTRGLGSGPLSWQR